VTTTTAPRNAGRTAVSQLCADDVIRSPRNNRFVRIDRVERNPGELPFVHGRYLDNGHGTLFALPMAARPTRYVA